MDNQILENANQLAARIVELRRAIHREPELGFAEHRTADLVAGTLRSLGLRVETGVAKTGVVGYIGSEGPVVALRADMDALPIQEQNQTDYASAVPDVMHACGHDAHTACLLGAAMILSRIPLAGQVRLLFQPSEEGMDAEGKSGGRRMAEEGIVDGVSAVACLHVDSTYPAGTVACSAGPIAASMDNFVITILGRAAHGAQAHLGVDAILLAAQVVTALHTVVARRIAAMDCGLISIGTIHGGTKENNLCDRVELRGTIRAMDPNVRRTLIDEVERACGIARTLGGDYKLELTEGYPALSNDPALTAFARRVAGGLVRPEDVRDIVAEMGAEDFAFMAQRAPACYMLLGVGFPGQPPRPPHTPIFDIDEAALPLGAALLAQFACTYLEEKAAARPGL